ncbi:hypothetical protein Csa_023850, partial [Cucumis sativus]
YVFLSNVFSLRACQNYIRTSFMRPLYHVLYVGGKMKGPL